MSHYHSPLRRTFILPSAILPSAAPSLQITRIEAKGLLKYYDVLYDDGDVETKVRHTPCTRPRTRTRPCPCPLRRAVSGALSLYIYIYIYTYHTNIHSR